ERHQQVIQAPNEAGPHRIARRPDQESLAVVPRGGEALQVRGAKAGLALQAEIRPGKNSKDHGRQDAGEQPIAGELLPCDAHAPSEYANSTLCDRPQPEQSATSFTTSTGWSRVKRR